MGNAADLAMVQKMIIDTLHKEDKSQRVITERGCCSRSAVSKHIKCTVDCKLVQWPWCYCAWLASKLAWPEPHRESIGYCQEEEERHQTQQCRWAEGRYQSILGFHYTWAVPPADCLHATPHWCSNSCKRRPNQVLTAYKLTYFSEAWHFCLKYPFLIDLM